MQALGWNIITTSLHSGVVSQKRIYVFTRKIPLIGTVAKLQRPEKVDFKQVKRLIDKHKIAVFYIEPSTSIGNGARKTSPSVRQTVFEHAKSAFLPSRTIHIDLTKPEIQLLKEMKPKTRYNIKIAQKRGVGVKQSAQIGKFVNLWKSTARQRLALPQSKEITALWQASGKKANILLAYYNKSLVAGVLLIRSPDTAFYMYAASSREGKKLFAPTLVVWEAIKLSKKVGCKIFDFDGVFDGRYSSTKSWKGFTKFKEGFGGKIVEYPKTIVWHKNSLLKLLNI